MPNHFFVIKLLLRLLLMVLLELVVLLMNLLLLLRWLLLLGNGIQVESRSPGTRHSIGRLGRFHQRLAMSAERSSHTVTLCEHSFAGGSGLDHLWSMHLFQNRRCNISESLSKYSNKISIQSA
jgi:hypothetical protein